jgi:hypothetical protein
VQPLPEGWMIVNALHARPVLARTLPWYKDRALRRAVRQHGRGQPAGTATGKRLYRTARKDRRDTGA